MWIIALILAFIFVPTLAWIWVIAIILLALKRILDHLL